MDLTHVKRQKPRAAVILVKDGKVALLERHRPDKHYFVFPGGGVDRAETAEQAAVREAEEELGLQVTILRLVAEVWYNGLPQYYYLADISGGEFGSGKGKEMRSSAESEQGSYHPCWIPIEDLIQLPVLPTIVARYVQHACREGWPDQPLCLREAIPD